MRRLSVFFPLLMAACALEGAKAPTSEIHAAVADHKANDKDKEELPKREPSSPNAPAQREAPPSPPARAPGDSAEPSTVGMGKMAARGRGAAEGSVAYGAAITGLSARGAGVVGGGTAMPSPAPHQMARKRDAPMAKSNEMRSLADVAHDELDRRDMQPEGGRFERTLINDLIDAQKDHLSTFAIDVDTGSYTFAKRQLENGALPLDAGVRVEEWVNAFHYQYPDESSQHPFSIHMEGAPLAKQSMVLRIGVQGKRIEAAKRDPVHLTFLVDVSGSMHGPDRLPLAQRSLELLVEQLNEKDSVSLVTYAGNTGVVLPSTHVTREGMGTILSAIRNLQSGGGTAMGSGMELAYREANKSLAEKGISRVIVLSDGDANIGRTGYNEILASIKGYVSEGVTLSTVGFGTGNYRDDMMEGLADAGNGNYSYIGGINDARKVFVENLTGTLQVIAKDTKIQVDMNPDVVKSYRLIGYENRDVADRDFRNDKVDAGEIGAGHTVTALYEVQLKDDGVASGNIATVRVRYKKPKGEKAIETAATFTETMLRRDVNSMSADGRFAVGVGLAAEALRHSPHMTRLGLTLADAVRMLRSADDGHYQGERKEFVQLLAPFADGTGVATR